MVSTVLQFPPSSILTEMIYFFMDSLAIYKDFVKACELLQSQIETINLEDEVRSRQRHIFSSSLMRRLRALLFDESKHIRVRRLAAQLIMALCLDYAPGWHGLMKHQSTSQTFGSLMRNSNDYVLRILVTDIIRHLQGQNFEPSEIWDMTDEPVLDFPSSLDLTPATIKEMVKCMSGMDLTRAAIHGTSQIFLIREIHVPERQLHSGTPDTLLVLDEQITVLMPDKSNDRTTILLHEIAINEHIMVDSLIQPQRADVHVSWKNNKGAWLIKGKKTAINRMTLQLEDTEALANFMKAFENAKERAISGSFNIAASQDESAVQQESQRISIGFVHFSEADGSEFTTDDDEHAEAGTPQTLDRLGQAQLGERKGSQNEMTDQARLISSDSVIQQRDPANVFELTSNLQNERRATKLTQKLQASQEESKQQQSVRTNFKTPKIMVREQGLPYQSRSTSPLKKHAKRNRDISKHDGGGASEPQAIRHSKDPASTVPLDQLLDSDFATFQSTATNHTAKSHELNESPAKRQRQTRAGIKISAEAVAPSSKLIKSKKTPATRLAASDVKSGQPELQGPKKLKKIVVLEDESGMQGPSKSRAVVNRTLAKTNPEVRVNAKSSTRPSHHETQTTEKLLSGKSNSQSGKESTIDPRRAKGTEEDPYKIPSENDSAASDPEQTMKRTSKHSFRPPLKESTNDSQRPGSQKRPLTETKGSKARSKVAKKKPSKSSPKEAEITAASRRTRRSVAKKVANYEELPSTLEEDDVEEEEQEDAERGDSDADEELSQQKGAIHSRQKQSSKKLTISSVNLQARSIPRAQRASHESPVLNIDRGADASPSHFAVSTVIVPSSDPVEAREKKHKAQQSARKKPNANLRTAQASPQADEGEVAQDSYPKEQQILPQPDEPGESFGKMLNNSLPSVLPSGQPMQSGKVHMPFGDPKQFVHNVNAAKSSDSPIKPTPDVQAPRKKSGQGDKVQFFQSRDEDHEKKQTMVLEDRVTAPENVGQHPLDEFQAPLSANKSVETCSRHIEADIPSKAQHSHAQDTVENNPAEPPGRQVGHSAYTQLIANFDSGVLQQQKIEVEKRAEAQTPNVTNKIQGRFEIGDSQEQQVSPVNKNEAEAVEHQSSLVQVQTAKLDRELEPERGAIDDIVLESHNSKQSLAVTAGTKDPDEQAAAATFNSNDSVEDTTVSNEHAGTLGKQNNLPEANNGAHDPQSKTRPRSPVKSQPSRLSLVSQKTAVAAGQATNVERRSLPTGSFAKLGSDRPVRGSIVHFGPSGPANQVSSSKADATTEPLQRKFDSSRGMRKTAPGPVHENQHNQALLRPVIASKKDPAAVSGDLKPIDANRNSVKSPSSLQSIADNVFDHPTLRYSVSPLKPYVAGTKTTARLSPSKECTTEAEAAKTFVTSNTNFDLDINVKEAVPLQKRSSLHPLQPKAEVTSTDAEPPLPKGPSLGILGEADELDRHFRRDEDIDYDTNHDKMPAAPASPIAPISNDNELSEGKHSQPITTFHNMRQTKLPASSTHYDFSHSHPRIVHESQLRWRPGDSQERPIDISSSELLSEQESESEFEASRFSERASPTQSPRATRRTLALAQESAFQSRESGQVKEQEQETEPSPIKKHTIGKPGPLFKAQEARSPDDISHFVDAQHPQASKNMSLTVANRVGTSSISHVHQKSFADALDARPLPTKSVTATGTLPTRSSQAPSPKQVVAQADTTSPRRVRPIRNADMPPPAEPKLGVRDSPAKSRPLRDPQVTERGRDDAARLTSTAPNIKRLRQIPNEHPKPPPPVAAFTSTPQPFYHHFNAATSPASDTDSFTASELQQMSHNQSDVGETTLVEQMLLTIPGPRRSPSVESGRTSGGTASPQPEACQTGLRGLTTDTKLDAHTSNDLQQGLQRIMAAITRVSLLILHPPRFANWTRTS